MRLSGVLGSSIGGVIVYVAMACGSDRTGPSAGAPSSSTGGASPNGADAA